MKNFIKILILICLVIGTTACGKPKVEDIKAKIEAELLKEYGEPFVVENIGLRDANGEKFYQATIYPKSIIGTPKENDEYYYSTASVDVARLDKPNSVGNSYGTIKMNDEAEEYLLPKAREIFGDRIRLKVDIEYLEKEGKYYTTYFEAGFKNKKELVAKDPPKYRMYLTLYLYVFDKMDSEKEKEARRKQLFEFLQYLRANKLDKYLEIFMVLTDDIILAPSFEEKKYDLENDLEKRKEIEKSLREEIESIDVNTVYKNINLIKKSDLQLNNDSDIYAFCKSRFLILTMEMLKIDEYGRYDEAKETNTVDKHYYKNKSDIEYKDFEKYLFKEGE